MSQRIVIETPCGHGWVKEHGKNPGNWLGETCPGGSREVLVLDEMVEKGAKVLYSFGDESVMPYQVGWGNEPDYVRETFLRRAKVVLVAALGLEET